MLDERISTNMKRSMLDLTERVAVVIGATSGLGKEIALGLAEHGAHVIPGGRRLDRLEQTCAEIRALKRRTIVHPVNAEDRTSLESLRAAVLAEFGRVDILVNAAGRTFRKPTIQIERAEWS